MAPLTSIRVNGDDIEIVNQLLLPHVIEYLPIQSIDEAHEAIKSMKIRGAPAIASLASLSISSHLSKSLQANPRPDFLTSPDSLSKYLNERLSFLYTSRPTAVNLGTAIKRLRAVTERSLQTQQETVDELAYALIKEGRTIADEDVGRNKEMSKHGAEWLLQEVAKRKLPGAENGLNVLTVCNTGSLATSGYGTALGLITYLHETGKLNKAYYTQTTPYHQGSRLTSFELKSLQIPSVMICDTMVGSLFQNLNIHAVVVGADRVARNGDTANKIGTYNAAVLADRHGIPFVVVAPISTLDLDIPSGAHIPIEHRPAIEACTVRGIVYPVESHTRPQQVVVQITPDLDLEQGVYNPSFDVTPASLISAVATEKGVAARQSGQEAIDLTFIA